MMSSEKIHVRHILVQHKYEADDIYKKLQEGASFADMARKYSTCSSAKVGGDLGSVPLSKLDLDFQDGIQGLKEKAVSKPFRTRYGYHIVERLG